MTDKTKPIIWTISGADCSGGAGIAADIKTGQCLQVEVCHLITANTVQNSRQLIAINPVDIGILQQQVDALIFDKPPTAIKIGLIADFTQLQWLCQTLTKIKQEHPQINIIYDPVAQASVGGVLTPLSTEQLKPLLKLINVITPNLIEAQSLSANSSTKSKVLAEKLHALGVNTIIIKGGHNESLTENTLVENNSCLDYCRHQLSTQIDDFIEYQLSSIRLNTSYSHGGGCSFATALSAFLAHGYLIRDAFTLTKAFINQGLATQQNKTQYYGAFEQTTWPKQAKYFPKVIETSEKNASLSRAFNSLSLLPEQKLGLYPVVNSIAWLKKLLPLNLNIIQLRLKNLTTQELEATIIEAIELSKDYATRLFINDYWQLAIRHGAYGVHIGQEDLQDADLHVIQTSGLRLGISTHGCYEFLLAQQLCPSYLAIGAIFPTKTKDMTGQIQGLTNLKHLIKLATDIPVVAIGGINLTNAANVLQTGVDSIAVVTAITEASDPEQAIADFQQLINLPETSLLA